MIRQAQIQALSCLAIAAIASNVWAQGQEGVFDAKGFQTNRDYISQLPFEHFDPATGSLILTFTDLVLPGNGGRDIRFQRTYNSKGNSDVGSWVSGVEGLVGVGDTFRPGLDEEDPGATLYTSDGGQHRVAIQLYNYPGNQLETRRIMMTDRFWTLHRCLTPQITTCPEKMLWMPDGSVTYYNIGGIPIRTRDAFGQDVLTVEQSGTAVTYKQHLGNGQERRVVATPGAQAGSWSMTLKGQTPDEDRTWTIVGDGIVTPPVGPTWGFNGHVLTLPNGGRVEYDFEQKIDVILGPGEFKYTRVLTERRAYERDGTLIGTWKYRYGPEPLDAVMGDTEVETPDGVITRYKIGYASMDDGGGVSALVNEFPGRNLIVKSKTVFKTGQELEREDRTYAYVSMFPGTPRTDGLPELRSQTITRGGSGGPTYSTTFTYSPDRAGDFHNPSRIEEAGDSGQTSRTTDRTYLHTTTSLPFQGPYILGMPTQETVSVGGQTQSFTTVWDPEPSTGFVRSENRYGITTSFERDDYGNVEKVTKGNGKETSYEYSFGQVSRIEEGADDPILELVTTRQINLDGTVHSETQRNRTAIFGYDRLGRMTSALLPGGTNPIVRTYDNNAGTFVQTDRGDSWVKTTVDGFGRPTTTENVAGAKTHMRYDAEGRQTYQSLPFYGTVGGPTDIGDSISYDGLGRLLATTHADGTSRVHTYSGTRVTIVDEASTAQAPRVTELTHSAFGDPADTRLTRVKDATGFTWNYAYNTVGLLRWVTDCPSTPPCSGGVTRTWDYSGRNLLISESHPESGATTSPDTPEYYDGAGMLQKKRDANLQTLQYIYDDADRLTRVAVDGQAITALKYEQGTNNRREASSLDVDTVFDYEETTGRVIRRIDTIDNNKTFRTGYEYDGNDNVRILTYPSGRQIQFVYDNANRITQVINPNAVQNQTLASGFEYHASGALQKYTAGNNVVTTLDYNPQRHWVQSLNVKLGGNNLLQLQYENYDGVGNVRRISDARSGMTQTLTYDVLDRLSQANGPYGSMTLNYDAHGNRQAANYVYDPNNRFRLTSIDNLAMTYDNNGNLKTGPQEQFDYTPTNLLKVAMVGSTTTRFGYDADDWRVKKAVDGGATTYYIRGADGQLLSEWKNTNPAIVKDYVYGGGRLLGVYTVELPQLPN